MYQHNFVAKISTKRRTLKKTYTYFRSFGFSLIYNRAKTITIEYHPRKKLLSNTGIKPPRPNTYPFYYLEEIRLSTQ